MAAPDERMAPDTAGWKWHIVEYVRFKPISFSFPDGCAKSLAIVLETTTFGHSGLKAAGQLPFVP